MLSGSGGTPRAVSSPRPTSPRLCRINITLSSLNFVASEAATSNSPMMASVTSLEKDIQTKNEFKYSSELERYLLF